MITIENTTPGVTTVVNENLSSRNIQRQPSSTCFVIGFAPWGPIGVRQLATSFADFRRKAGGFHPLGFLADCAKIFFDDYPGASMFFVRAGGGAAAKATITVANRAVSSPPPTFKFEAKYPSSQVDINVTVADIASDTSNVTITVASAFLNLVETYKVNLRDTVELAAFNLKSELVTASLVTTAVAGATGRPAAGTFTLAGGTDDSGTVDPADLTDYLDQFEDKTLGIGQVLIPGFYDASINAEVFAHCQNYRRVGFVDPEFATAYDAVPADFATHSGYGAVCYPWVEKQAVDTSRVKKFYPPSIFEAGECALADRQFGTQQAPANLRNIPGAVDLERNTDGSSVITDGVRGFLNGKNINVIAPRPAGIRMFGARLYQASGDSLIQFIHQRRLLNLIEYSIETGLESFNFRNLTPQGRTYRDVETSCRNFLRQLWQDGGLSGNTEDEAYSVYAGPNINTDADRAAGRLNVSIGVLLPGCAEKILVTISPVATSADLTGGVN